MKIWKLFKFSFIYFLIYPNKIVLTDSSQKEIINWNQIDTSSYEINEPKWEKIDGSNLKNNKINEPKWEKIDNFNFQKYEKKN